MVYQDSCGDVDSDCASSVEPRSPASDTTPDHSLESSFSSLDSEDAATRCAFEYVVDHIYGLHVALDALPSLVPSPNVNQLFSELVSTCLDSRHVEIADEVLEDAKIQELVPHLRQLCSTGESELESFWARRIAESEMEQGTPLACKLHRLSRY